MVIICKVFRNTLLFDSTVVLWGFNTFLCCVVLEYIFLCAWFSSIVFCAVAQFQCRACCGVVGFLTQQCPHLPRITQIICPSPPLLSLSLATIHIFSFFPFFISTLLVLVISTSIWLLSSPTHSDMLPFNASSKLSFASPQPLKITLWWRFVLHGWRRADWV